MASRGGGGGVWIATVILGLTTLVFLVFTLMFYGQVNSLKADAQTAQSDLQEFVGNQREDALTWVRGNQSAYAVLSGQLQETMRMVSGNEALTADNLASRISEIGIESGTPLLRAVSSLKAENTRLQSELGILQQTIASKEQEIAKHEKSAQEAARVFSEAQRNNRSTVDTYSDDVTETVASLQELEQDLRDRVEDIRADAEADKARLEAEITRLGNENLVLQGQIQQLRRERRTDLVRPKDEFALVDARIIGIAGAEKTVTIDRGRRDKIVLGLSFAVYSDATALRPDAEGNYPPGKAVIEVINVGETSSTARILTETQGNPVVRGDVIANAIYDPNKVYTFLVFGNFDTDGDGRATPFERDGIEALIRDWNGRVVNELTGDVDMLVLGERPLLPPRPSGEAPVEQLQEWIRLSQIVNRYDELQARAEATSIPILNQNRLKTLIGR
ncbi:MAG: hypothetical protein ACF8SC_06415 [Phycisphaerales bacterium JB037]